MIKEKNIMENTCKIATIAISLYRVFHSIRFKVNKVGVQRYSFFFAHTPDMWLRKALEIISKRQEKHIIKPSFSHQLI